MKIAANRILVIATRQIGDVLLVTPLLHSIRRAYPDACIDVLVFENKADILSGNPDINTTITIAERPSSEQYKALLSHIFRRYDLAISTLTGDRPIFYAFLAAKKRISVVPADRWQDKWKRFINQAWCEFDDDNTHTVTQNLQLAKLLEIPLHYKVQLPQHPDSIKRLNDCLPFAWQQEKFIVLHLLPMWFYKRWSTKAWCQLASYLGQKNYKIVLTGGNGHTELSYIETLKPCMPVGTVSTAGQLHFSEVARLLQSASLYIGPDTAVTHLAAAAGTPTVALFGPTNPIKWAPYPKAYTCESGSPYQRKGMQKKGNILLIQGEDERQCVPCHEEGCDRHRQSNSRCLQNLSANTVITAIQQHYPHI